MNKKDLIQSASAHSGMSRAEIEKALNSIIECIGQNLKKGDPVILVGFGTFQVQERCARQGLNPATKEIIRIPAKKVVKFKPGKGLDINSGK